MTTSIQHIVETVPYYTFTCISHAYSGLYNFDRMTSKGGNASERQRKREN